MSQVYSYVTEQIMGELKRGNIPWRKTWNSVASMPCNFVSKKQYRGINLMLLAFSRFACPYWLTFNQAKQIGGTVKKGEKGQMVVFWKMLKTEDKVSGKDKNIPLLRYYTVFNLEQCEGIAIPKVEEKQFNPIANCEKIVEGMPKRPTIEHGEARAYYRPATDTVNMPRKELFDGEQAYYATMFHELAHSTGHASRLNRKGVAEVAGFGGETYSKEELVAEMASSFLCSESGILNVTLSNSVAYIQAWLKRLAEDDKLIVQAASAATKAADFILGKLEIEESED